jgi:hypothetical protein
MPIEPPRARRCHRIWALVTENIHPVGWIKRLANAYRGFRDFGGKLGDITRENVILSDECISLRRKVADLEARLITRASVKRRAPFLYVDGTEDPICTRCWTLSEQAVVMNPFRPSSDGRPTFHCNVCDAYEKDYTKKESEPRGPTPFALR